MARTIIIDEIKKDESATAMSVDGVAKAWSNFDATTITIGDSLNVSSITDVGTGDQQLNLTNSMGNTDYAVAGSGLRGTVNNAQKWDGTINTENEAVGVVRLRSGYVDTYSGNVINDYVENKAIVFGDLA